VGDGAAEETLGRQFAKLGERVGAERRRLGVLSFSAFGRRQFGASCSGSNTPPLSPMAPPMSPFAKGEARSRLTDMAPADCPKIVTRVGSPPKAPILALTQRSAAIWSCRA
jgi:hypothetical protein